MNIDCHVVRERLQVGLFNIFPIGNSKQPANVFTKALEKHAFNYVINKLDMIDFNHTT